MADTVQNPCIGQAVYKNCAPLDAGKIVDVLGPTANGFFMRVAVKWVKTGDIKTVSTAELKDLKSLRDDCLRKLNTHEETLRKVEKL